MPQADFAASNNIRITAGASDVTGQSFTASLNSWGDTVLYGAGLTYVELGPHFGFVQTGSFNTQQVRPWNQLTANTSSRINFSSAFSMPPKVVVWLTSVDMSRDQNWRIVASASDIDNNGFTIHLDTWSDPTLYSAGATWIAYPAD